MGVCEGAGAAQGSVVVDVVVDVDAVVLVRVLALQEEQLGDDQVRHHIVDRGAQEDDAVLEQARVDVIGTLAAAGLLDDVGNGDEVLLVHGDRSSGVTR